MSKKTKVQKSQLSAQERELGKKRIYLIIGMIVAGLAVALYNIQ